MNHHVQVIPHVSLSEERDTDSSTRSSNAGSSTDFNNGGCRTRRENRIENAKKGLMTFCKQIKVSIQAKGKLAYSNDWACQVF